MSRQQQSMSSSPAEPTAGGDYTCRHLIEDLKTVRSCREATLVRPDLCPKKTEVGKMRDFREGRCPLRASSALALG